MVVKKKVKKVSKLDVGTTSFTQKVDWKSGTMGTPEKLPKKSVFKLLIHQWQFWLLVAVFVIVVAAAVINESRVINGKDVQSGQTPLNDTIARVFGQAGEAFIGWMNLVVLLIVMCFVVGAFIALGKIFR
jgi:hypothetical protein